LIEHSLTFMVHASPAIWSTDFGLSSIFMAASDLSQLAVASLPSTNILKSRPTTNSVWWSNLFIGFCWLQSQMIVDMSYEALARILAWYGENLILFTASWCPGKIMIGESVVARRSQSLIKLSVLAVATKFSYLLKSIERISFVWPWIRFTSFPVLKSHTLHVWSPEHDPKMDSWVGCHLAS